MLNCVYHPIDAMRVVEDDEREVLLASGFWFDSPAEALKFRSKVEVEIKEESQPKAKLGRPKKENNNEPS